MDRKQISEALGVDESAIDIDVLPAEDLDQVAGGAWTSIISITIIDDKAGGTAQ